MKYKVYQGERVLCYYYVDDSGKVDYEVYNCAAKKKLSACLLERLKTKKSYFELWSIFNIKRLEESLYNWALQMGETGKVWVYEVTT